MSPASGAAGTRGHLAPEQFRDARADSRRGPESEVQAEMALTLTLTLILTLTLTLTLSLTLTLTLTRAQP